VDFNGVCDGHLVTSKPRGRHAAAMAPNTDATLLLMAVMLPLLTSFSQKRPRSLSPSLSLHLSNTPSHTSQEASAPLSPLPASGSELYACLSDFAESTGIDLTSCEDTLMVLELTPDIIPEVLVTCLFEVIGAVKSHIRKLQSYCKD